MGPRLQQSRRLKSVMIDAGLGPIPLPPRTQPRSAASRTPFVHTAPVEPDLADGTRW